MEKRTKIVLLVTVICAAIGTVMKLEGHKTGGDVLLMASTILWFWLLYRFVIHLRDNRQLF
ncbi:hypothetical protein [Flavobacterium sp. '19STA2R22 D10 B1']|uniref:hypothetical protein n=1 Tax=Flavobacterium aerium TaxID=3037261 RepID=UPI00278C578B|nr:hypothetical protein [Flavobacterium sp. '19STA2R22 D10 B1']